MIKYIIATFYIFKNKIYYLDLFRNVPRIEPKLPLYRQLGYFYSDPTEILYGLFLGSCYNAFNFQELKKENINVIINVTEEIENFHQDNLMMTYYRYPIKDNNLDDISEILDETCQIIEHHLEKQDKILVHCFMGASRSASIIIYYVMRKFKINYETAKLFVYRKRKSINLSHKFDATLKQKNILI